MDVNAHDPHEEDMQATLPTCPRCHQANQTRKVSDYFNASLDLGAPPLDGSALAQLALPEEPVPPQREAVPHIPIPRKAFIITGILIALFIAMIGLIRIDSPDTTPAPALIGFLQQVALALVILISIVGFVGSIYLLPFLFQPTPQQAAEHAAEERYQAALVAYHREVEHWKHLCARWADDLYYCRQDNVIFTPHSAAGRPEDMLFLLSQ